MSRSIAAMTALAVGLWIGRREVGHHPLQQCEVSGTRVRHLAFSAANGKAVGRPVRNGRFHIRRAANGHHAAINAMRPDWKGNTLLPYVAAGTAVMDFINPILAHKIIEGFVVRRQRAFPLLAPCSDGGIAGPVLSNLEPITN